MRELSMGKGELPFRYSGVPLHSKRLSCADCNIFVEKITTKTESWSVKFLSYGGRVELLRKVLFGVRNFWAQLFYLTK